MAPAVCCSAAAHAALLALALALVSHVAPSLSDGSVGRLLPPMTVWLDEPGPGGGGGGGGNRMQAPPRRLEVRGRDQASMPAIAASAVPPPSETPKDAPSPDQHFVVPIEYAGASLDTRPGTLDSTANGLSQGPGSGGGAGRGRGSGAGNGDGPGIGDGWGGGTGDGYFQLGAGIETPVLIREVKPNYTNGAMRARIQGTVWFEAIVMPDGTIGRIRLVRSLDSTFGLDEEAARAARQWRFRPGRRAGQPVPVLVSIAVDFHLQ